MLGPQMNIVSRIDQLRADTHAIARALHLALQNVRNAKFARDLAEIAVNAAFVLHYARSTDHFQISDLRQVR